MFDSFWAWLARFEIVWARFGFVWFGSWLFGFLARCSLAWFGFRLFGLALIFFCIVLGMFGLGSGLFGLF